MARRRVFVDWIDGKTAGVRGSRAHHLHRVVRLRPAELVEISDREKVFLATVTASEPESVEFAIEGELVPDTERATLTLQLAILKFARFEWAIEKATELGVRAIAPVAAARSDQRLVQAAARRAERWQRIADEAARQSLRIAPPRVETPVSFADTLAQTDSAIRLLLDPAGPALREVLASLPDRHGGVRASLLVGPEGGWTDKEQDSAHKAGYQPASLGSSILRAETAAIAAVAVVIHLLGE